MKYFLLRYNFVPDYLERRDEFRAPHIDVLMKAKETGNLLMAGALTDPIDGATLLFLVEDRDFVEALVQADPFYSQGLVTSYEIREWNVTIK